MNKTYAEMNAREKNEVSHRARAAEKMRELMRQIGRVVFLTAREETLVERLSGCSDRPLLQGVDLRERIRSLSAARQEMYLDAADYQVATDGKTPEEIAREIIRVSGVQEMATDQKGAADAS